eukprot:CAMPEP_0179446568 /NCGR_PEP_ID=MMETSP0799-20121207/30032_1 /TAXON_ID=46947 /ORGANISM="Geminigera cryophila, Strain CCMP2564" /LENGTH=263 /DNA_ID=CAMNT_0021235777 /DNA_START=213 /DNA_END=1001 /DNA_ORIENTATION=-
MDEHEDNQVYDHGGAPGGGGEDATENKGNMLQHDSCLDDSSRRSVYLSASWISLRSADDLESLITALHVNFPETFAANSPAKEGGVNRKGSSPPPPAPPRSIQGLGERENARGDEMQLLQMLDVVMDGCVQRMGALERQTAREESVMARGSGTQAQAQLRAQLDAATAATAMIRGNVLQTSRVVEDKQDTLNSLQAQVKSLLHVRKESASLLVERDALQARLSAMESALDEINLDNEDDEEEEMAEDAPPEIVEEGRECVVCW